MHAVCMQKSSNLILKRDAKKYNTIAISTSALATAVSDQTASWHGELKSCSNSARREFDSHRSFFFFSGTLTAGLGLCPLILCTGF